MRAAAILLAAFLGAANILVSAQNWDGAPQLTSRAAPAAQEDQPRAHEPAVQFQRPTRQH